MVVGPEGFAAAAAVIMQQRSAMRAGDPVRIDTAGAFGAILGRTWLDRLARFEFSQHGVGDPGQYEKIDQNHDCAYTASPMVEGVSRIASTPPSRRSSVRLK